MQNLTLIRLAPTGEAVHNTNAPALSAWGWVGPRLPCCWRRILPRKHRKEDAQEPGGAETGRTPPVKRANYNSARPVLGGL